MSSGNWIRWREYPQIAPMLTRAIVTGSDLIPRAPPVPLTPIGMSQMFDLLEGDGFKPRWLLMNALTYAPIRKFGRDVLDVPPERAPGHADLWGATILTDRGIPPDVILAIDSEGQTVRFAAAPR